MAEEKITVRKTHFYFLLQHEELVENAVLLLRYLFQTVQHFGRSFEDLAGKLSSVRHQQDEERHNLIEVSNALKAQSRFFSKSVSGILNFDNL